MTIKLANPADEALFAVGGQAQVPDAPCIHLGDVRCERCPVYQPEPLGLNPTRQLAQLSKLGRNLPR